MVRPNRGYQFDFSGGELCLDFVNTLGDRPRRHEEHLGGWADLAAWGEQAHLFWKRDVAALRAKGAAHPLSFEKAFARAIELRERLYLMFAALAAGRAPTQPDLTAFNADLGEVIGHARVIPTRGRGFSWGWTEGEASLDRLLWPVVRSTADLLVSAERANIRECASDTCSWLFVDRSRTKRRRWCSMKTCGNRDKVRRFYRRQHSQTSLQSAPSGAPHASGAGRRVPASERVRGPGGTESPG